MAEADPETLLEWLSMGQGEEREMQLIALEQLCMLLLMSDNVDRCFERLAQLHQIRFGECGKLERVGVKNDHHGTAKLAETSNGPERTGPGCSNYDLWPMMSRTTTGP